MFDFSDIRPKGKYDYSYLKKFTKQGLSLRLGKRFDSSAWSNLKWPVHNSVLSQDLYNRLGEELRFAPFRSEPWVLLLGSSNEIMKRNGRWKKKWRESSNDLS